LQTIRDKDLFNALYVFGINNAEGSVLTFIAKLMGITIEMVIESLFALQKPNYFEINLLEKLRLEDIKRCAGYYRHYRKEYLHVEMH